LRHLLRPYNVFRAEVWEIDTRLMCAGADTPPFVPLNEGISVYRAQMPTGF